MSKVWLITGASSGLGFELVQQALAQGDRVIGCVRRARDADRLNAVGAVPKCLDVRGRDDCFDVAAEVVKEHGRIDIAVANAIKRGLSR